MSEEIRILQLGNSDWSKQYRLPDYVNFTYAEVFSEAPKTPYELVFLDRQVRKEELKPLLNATKAHTLYVTEAVELRGDTEQYLLRKCGKRITKKKIQDFLLHETENYFAKPYGEKFRLTALSVAQGFTGSVAWNGNYSLTLNGDYGEELSQVVYWRTNIPIFEGQAIDFWLEYEKDPDVEIALKITQFRKGSISTIQQEWYFSEQELKGIVTADNRMATGPVFLSLFAKGKGMLRIIALHDRYSRRGHGIFLPGGERYVTSNREEIFYYFDPGDLKPPLNVYFSGYKTLQGFEGYYMMRKMGCPFLLIGEPRLEGGCFYMGSEEYETALADIIRKHAEKLGFTSKDIVLSGMSMGTYGALYYGCDIKPHAMILGKPLASIGDVAENERLHRPGGFPTSLDMLNFLTGDMDAAAIKQLNDRFWDKFDATDWKNSKIIAAYMIEDDYDSKAYQMLISHLKTDGLQIYGKGIHGRHNDATGPIAQWFKMQYEQVLREDFGREGEKK